MSDNPPHYTSIVQFLVNGTLVTLENPSPSLRLAEYLRSPGVRLMGTKVGCGEGGCGSCTVVLTRRETKEDGSLEDRLVDRAINACLRPVCTLDGTAITTIEGLGSTRTTLNPIQTRVVRANATQCGFCTPGFIMNMYGLLCETREPTPREIEERFSGNLCRCTGYRPILDAMHAFDKLPQVPVVELPPAEELVLAVSSVAILESVPAEEPATEAAPTTDVSTAVILEPVSATDVSTAAVVELAPAVAPALAVASDTATLTVTVRSTNGNGTGAGNHPDEDHDGDEDEDDDLDLPVVSERQRDLARKRTYRSDRSAPMPDAQPIRIVRNGIEYVRPLELPDLLAELIRLRTAEPGREVRLLSGATSLGIYPDQLDGADVLLDLSGVRQLRRVRGKSTLMSEEIKPLEIGGAVTFARLLKLLGPIMQSKRDELTAPQRAYRALGDLVARIANEQVRSVATIGGNVMLTRSHATQLRSEDLPPDPPLPSDFLTAATLLDARLTFRTFDDPDKEQNELVLHDQLALGPGASAASLIDALPLKALITSVIIPEPPAADCWTRTYKVGRRDENAHAIVNAGFQVQFHDVDGKQRVRDARLVFGGIRRLPCVATRTRDALRDKPWTAETLDAALVTLREEIGQLIEEIPDIGVSPEYRIELATSLFFKFVVEVTLATGSSMVPLTEHDRSAVASDERMISKGDVKPLPVEFRGFTSLGWWLEREDQLDANAGVGLVARRLIGNPNGARGVGPKAPLTEQPEAPDKKKAPPPPKVSGPIQATGEARFTVDEHGPPGALEAVFVLSERAHARFWYSPDDTTPTAARPPLYDDALFKLKEQLAADPVRFPGFRGYFTSHDIPVKGFSDVYNGAEPDDYDPVFATGRVTAYGQPIGLVVADTLAAAQHIAAYVRSRIWYYAVFEPVTPDAIQTIADARALGGPSAARPRHTFRRLGSSADWIKDQRPDVPPPIADGAGKHGVFGRIRTGAAAHFYLEPQITLAIPGEDGALTILCSSQSLQSVHTTVAMRLGVPSHTIRVRTNRLGGSFGAKERRPPNIAAATAIAAVRLNRPVRLALDRKTDMAVIGKQHPFIGEYWAVIDDSSNGIEKLRIDMAADTGCARDVGSSVAELAALSADGAYEIPTFQANGTIYRTNVEPRTAFRSFGVIQATIVLEDAIEQLAHARGVAPEVVREANFYRDRVSWDTRRTHYGQELRDSRVEQVWGKLKKEADFEDRLTGVKQFNRENRWRKRGLTMIPLKYGIGYTHRDANQATAQIVAYRDGSVRIHHAGVEMGQGLDTKIKRIAARELGISEEMIRVADIDTGIIPNPSATGASTGTDLVGGAVQDAARKLRNQLERIWRPRAGRRFQSRAEAWKDAWVNVVKDAYDMREPLISVGFARPPVNILQRSTGQLRDDEQLFYYFTYGAAACEVEIDVLTGESSIKQADIAYDAGISIASAIDIGQVQGAFVQGVGILTTEQTRYAPNGRLITNGTWEYKPPLASSIPEQFNVHLLEYGRVTDESTTDGGDAGGGAVVLNPDGTTGPMAPPLERSGVLSSKATGEPPLVLAVSAFCAIKQAILAARREHRPDDPNWFPLDAPATVERIREACFAPAPS